MNKSVKIYLNKISDIKEFAGIVTSFAPNVDIIKGSVVYDAKSIMGVILLGGTDPVEVKIHADDNDVKTIEAFANAMSRFSSLDD